MRLLTLVSLFALLSFSLAEDKKEDKKEEKKPEHPLGKFVKSVNNFEISFEFKKDDVLILRIADGDNGMTLTAKAKYEKDGLVKCKTEEFTVQGNFPVQKEKGYEFSFKYRVDGKKVVISELDGSDINDEARDIVGGDYEKAEK